MCSEVYSLQSDVDVYVVRKKVLGKNKFVGHTRIPVPSLVETPERRDWFPVMEYLSPKKLQKNFKKEAAKIGEMRLTVKYTSLKEKVEDVKGELVLVRIIYIYIYTQ
jgi:hypothetical protein